MCTYNLSGIKGTYQGLTATIIKQGSNQAIRFFVYTSIKKWIQDGDNTKEIGNVKTFLTGGVAGAASVFGNTPVDVVKTRMQVYMYNYYIPMHILIGLPKNLCFVYSVYIYTVPYIFHFHCAVSDYHTHPHSIYT